MRHRKPSKDHGVGAGETYDVVRAAPCRAILDGVEQFGYFVAVPRHGDCRMAAGRRVRNRFFAGDPEKPLEFSHEDNDGRYS